MEFTEDEIKEFLPLIVAAVVGLLGVLFFVFKGFGKPKVLPLDDFKPFPLIRKEVLSHDSARFTFGLPAGHVMGLPTGQHISFKCKDKAGKVCQRSYTPVSDNTLEGEIQFVIKVYKPLPPKFPDGGVMSQHVDNLKIGDTLLMKGPKGHMTWLGNGGKFDTKPLGKPIQHRNCEQLGLIAGGTGITPMLQVLNAVFRYPGDDSIKGVKLIYANQTEDDILIRDELETLQKEFPDRFQLWYTVDKNVKGDSWKYDTGFVTKEMIEKHLTFDNKKKTQFFMCGPPPMLKFAIIPNLKELGYSENDWVAF